jgi:acyl-CoA synthetase (AMP-forming)/AMP-acid ligase II
VRLVEAIRQIVQRYPDQVSVEDTTERLTYREMWNRSMQASLRLRSATPGYVLIQEPRSCRLIVKLLAVWLAGHAPLLLDPNTPSRRIEEICQLVRPLDTETPRSSEGVEYLVTTSGSSGQPKVVQIGNGSLYHVILYQIQEFRTNNNSSVAWILSPGFDASLSDVGTALCAGARLVCFESSYPDRLDQITHLDIPPALLQLYRPGSFPSTLRTLVVGGEVSRPDLLREWARYHRLVAVYGPSETTVCSSTAVVNNSWDKPYIGLPLPEVKYAVEEDELLIGGPTVGLGYLDTSGRFFERDGERWYRTGDRVGAAHDQFGHSFLGRIDRQVQLRGQRFEPEELEQRATQIVQSDCACEIYRSQVVLCWKTLGKPLAEEESLRKALAEQLLPGWLPHHYVSLDELPRNQVLKIDRPRLRSLLTPLLTEQMSSLERLALCQYSRENLKVDPPAEPSRRESGSKARSKASLLVTGLTGRLGRALEPLLQDQFEVWSLHRGTETERAFKASLTATNFGLCQDRWEFLERETDAVLHLAGQVDLSLDLETLRPINVEPLNTLIALGKPVHYASTLAVPLCTDGNVFGGYAQSKWLSESLLKNIPGLTIRYGHLMGRPRDDELLSIVVRGLIELGCCPLTDDPLLCFDWTPLSWAAETTAVALQRTVSERYTVPVRRGWHFHLSDLAVQVQKKGVELVEPTTFFRLTPSGRCASLAQAALWKCHSEPGLNRAFDLFLLGNSETMLAQSEPGPEIELAMYVEDCLLGLSRP